MNILTGKSTIKIKKKVMGDVVLDQTKSYNDDICFLTSLKSIVAEHGLSDSIKDFINLDEVLATHLNMDSGEESINDITEIINSLENKKSKHHRHDDDDHDGDHDDDDDDDDDGDHDGDDHDDDDGDHDGDDHDDDDPEKCPKEGDPDFDDIKEGRMHELLGIEEGKDINEVFKTGEELAKALVAKSDYVQAMRMLVYAANFSKESTIFQDAVDYLKSHPELKK